MLGINTENQTQDLISFENTKLSFHIAKKAAERIRFLQEMELNDSKLENAMLRILVYSGGCKGFSYHLEMTGTSEEGDIVITDAFGKNIAVIDEITLEMINGGILDFVDEVSGSYFRIKNPNAQNSCGCGNSFS